MPVYLLNNQHLGFPEICKFTFFRLRKVNPYADGRKVGCNKFVKILYILLFSVLHKVRRYLGSSATLQTKSGARGSSTAGPLRSCSHFQLVIIYEQNCIRFKLKQSN